MARGFGLIASRASAVGNEQYKEAIGAGAAWKKGKKLLEQEACA